MLLTLFTVGATRYALDAAHITEILPLIGITPIPGAPPHTAGVVNYRGTPVPILDLNILAAHPPAPRLLTTRILIIQRSDRHLGLLAAGVTETLRVSNVAPAPNATRTHAAWLGPLITHGSGFLQRIEVDPLFRELETAA